MIIHFNFRYGVFLLLCIILASPGQAQLKLYWEMGVSPQLSKFESVTTISGVRLEKRASGLRPVLGIRMIHEFNTRFQLHTGAHFHHRKTRRKDVTNLADFDPRVLFKNKELEFTETLNKIAVPVSLGYVLPISKQRHIVSLGYQANFFTKAEYEGTKSFEDNMGAYSYILDGNIGPNNYAGLPVKLFANQILLSYSFELNNKFLFSSTFNYGRNLDYYAVGNNRYYSYSASNTSLIFSINYYLHTISSFESIISP